MQVKLEKGGHLQNSTFSEYGHVAYQIKGNDACINRIADTPLPPKGVGSKDQNSTLSEHGHVACQLNTEENHMTLLLSPYPCFISLLYLDLYVLGDDSLIS